MFEKSELVFADEKAEHSSVADVRRESVASTWVTSVACLLCVGVFLGITANGDVSSWEMLARFGYLPANEIWRGQYWSLITSAFVHLALWHVAFNVYWLWTLGSRLERAIGSIPFLVFVLASAFVSSALQLTISDSTGIGASGVVYAFFGFMWVSRRQIPLFSEVLTKQTITLFVIWLIGCLAATILDVWVVGNAAHFAGLIFGSSVAAAFVVRVKRPLMLSTVVGMVFISVVLLFWCPWSVTWLSTMAYNAHMEARYQDAIEMYTQVIQISPENSWAYLNRSYAYQALGDHAQAEADLKMARKLDPTINLDG